MSDEEAEENFMWSEQEHEHPREWVSLCMFFVDVEHNYFSFFFFFWSNYDNFGSSRMVLVKECQHLADKTSIQGGIPNELVNHVDEGLEIVVRKLCVYVKVFLYISFLLTNRQRERENILCMLLYIFHFQARILSSVYWLFIFLFSLFSIFSPVGGSELGESQHFKSEVTCARHNVFSVLILKPLRPLNSEASDNFMYMSLIFFLSIFDSLTICLRRAVDL